MHAHAHTHTNTNTHKHTHTHTHAHTDGEVWCWGKGNRGRLGRELEEDSADPQPVAFEHRQIVQSLACSHAVTMLLATPIS